MCLRLDLLITYASLPRNYGRTPYSIIDIDVAEYAYYNLVMM